MHTTFDSTKDAANFAKHGVSLAWAADMEWDSAVTWPDTRRVYGEPRQCGIGYIGLRLFFVAFVDRADGRRIISLRKANSREEKRYAHT
ncbi:MAG: BrnT family toxin [Sterolibacterium sp.]|nr:BrnT family toxin [Sterolibacterium sp.]MBP9800959.1 BrnT family toxin [Sterolibacterium sp.]